MLTYRDPGLRHSEHNAVLRPEYQLTCIMKGTKVQTVGAVHGAWLVASAIMIIMAMGAIINTHAHR